MTLIDSYGRTVTVVNGVYSIPGLSISGVSQDQALATINAHAPTPTVLPPPVEISAEAFYERFTDAEKLAVQTLALSNAQTALGLTHGVVRGTVTLTGPTLAAWMQGLVSAGAITADRQKQILTP